MDTSHSLIFVEKAVLLARKRQRMLFFLLPLSLSELEWCLMARPHKRIVSSLHSQLGSKEVC
jgi:hypothetical protein